MSDIAIRVENLSKLYHIGKAQKRHDTLRDAIVDFGLRIADSVRANSHSPIPNPQSDTIWALRDVSFDVHRGEVIGIIGRNGAGKSTLLKILSRITEPTSGRAEIHGRVASLLEVGTGFHPELTGRENIYLNGAILGMHRTEIVRRFDEIVAFAEIEKFLDTPVKHYSSGMYVRLAFAVAAHLEPEILLVDEVLAVGDAQFQKKALGKMGDVVNEGRTVLFVSHNMAAIRQLCPKTVLLNHGNVTALGDTFVVVSDYLRTCSGSDGNAERVLKEDQSKAAQLRRIRVLDELGRVSGTLECDKPVTIELLYQVHRHLPGLYGYLQISKLDGICIMVSDSFDVVSNPLDNLAPGMYQVRIVIPARTLGVGDYSIYLNFTSIYGEKGFNIESPGIVCTFHLEDSTSSRGNQRAGYFSTLLVWTCNAYERDCSASENISTAEELDQ